MKVFENPEVQVKTFEAEDIINADTSNYTDWA